MCGGGRLFLHPTFEDGHHSHFCVGCWTPYDLINNFLNSSCAEISCLPAPIFVIPKLILLVVNSCIKVLLPGFLTSLRSGVRQFACRLYIRSFACSAWSALRQQIVPAPWNFESSRFRFLRFAQNRVTISSARFPVAFESLRISRWLSSKILCQTQCRC